MKKIEKDLYEKISDIISLVEGDSFVTLRINKNENSISIVGINQCEYVRDIDGKVMPYYMG